MCDDTLRLIFYEEKVFCNTDHLISYTHKVSNKYILYPYTYH